VEELEGMEIEGREAMEALAKLVELGERVMMGMVGEDLENLVTWGLAVMVVVDLEIYTTSHRTAFTVSICESFCLFLRLSYFLSICQSIYQYLPCLPARLTD
jgi:hypothetical protein